MLGLESGQPHRGNQCAGLFAMPARVNTAHLELQQHVVNDGAPIEQQIALEHHTQFSVGRLDRPSANRNVAACGPGEPGHHGEQCALAAATGPKEGNELATIDG